MKSVRLYVSGMTCAACATRIEKALARMEGIHQVSVNLALAQAFVRFDPQQISLQSVLQKIEQLGYRAADGRQRPDTAVEAEIRSNRNRFLAALAVSVPLMWAMLEHIPAASGIRMPPLFASPLVQLLLATILQFGIGFPFYYGAYQALKQRTANMDALVALSTSAAYFHSHYSVFRSGHTEGHPVLYFDTIAMIMTAVLLGKFLESTAKGRALKDLNALYDRQVRLVRVIRESGEEWIPVENLRKGDLVSVQSGEWIPADGLVVAGSSDVDESLLTGESRTVVKTLGDRVYGGTQSITGSMHIRAEALAGESRLSRLIALMEEAQKEKPYIQRKVDRIAAFFVPGMILSALATYAVWSYLAYVGAVSVPAIRPALAVLLAACPCALGLATPVSILLGTSLSLKSGILIKEGRALELLQRVNYVILDKTGTLTEGTPRLKAIRSFDGRESRLLRFVAAVEQYSSHPFSKALVEAAQQNRIAIPQAARVMEIPGKGIEGAVEGKTVRIGYGSWLKEQGMPLREQMIRPPLGTGETVLYVATDGKLSGTVTLTDRVRPEAFKTVQQLKRRAEVWMVTGDLEQPAGIVAAELGIQQVYAGMLPEQKLELVRSLQRKGHIVAMVGDGTNDAAALAAADVGIAMGGGTDAAVQAGNVVLVRNNLSGILDALAISRQTMRNIHQNLSLAVIYNTCMVPLAAVGMLNPKLACISMAASSVLVVTNALRLRRFKVKA